MDFEAWRELFQGAWVTLWICSISIACGMVLGLIIAGIRQAKVPFLAHLLALYTSIVRATPLVTLVLFLFLSLPTLEIELDMHSSAIVALTLNSAAFNSEIWRNALANFPRDQREAAQAVGMREHTFFLRIMLPQLVTRSMPDLINDMSALIKLSPAIAVIGLVDLTRATNRISAVTYEPLPPILGAAVIYIALISILLKLQKLSERKTHRLAV